MTGRALVVRGDARALPLPDESVDLIVTSPPYYALRAYTDGGRVYDGQIGSEPTPAEYIANLLDCTREWVRVLKPTGSLFVNLGDKYTPDKSLMGLPWRYALACVDQLGLILRAEIVWSKPNGLPEPVTDRVRRSHEQWFHLTRNPRYYAAVDEIREAHTGNSHPAGKRAAVTRWESGNGLRHRTARTDLEMFNPLGKLPGSVWEIHSEPLRVPAHLGVDHFAAFPTEWPRRIITGWSPPGALVVDPFGGTGTTALVAAALGRIGITVDRSADYCRLAQWRTTDPDERARALRVPKPPRPLDGQPPLFGDWAYDRVELEPQPGDADVDGYPLGRAAKGGA